MHFTLFLWQPHSILQGNWHHSPFVSLSPSSKISCCIYCNRDLWKCICFNLHMITQNLFVFPDSLSNYYLMDWRVIVNCHNGYHKVLIYLNEIINNTNKTSFRLLVNTKGLLRFIFILINNFYCIPTHCLWLLMLWPLRWIHPKAYLFLEGLGFQWLLTMVGSWSYTAGYDGIFCNYNHNYFSLFFILFYSCGNGRRNRKDSRWQSLGYDQPPEHIGCSAYYGGLWWSLSERHVDHGPHVYAHQFWNRVLVPQRFFHKLSNLIDSLLNNS